MEPTSQFLNTMVQIVDSKSTPPILTVTKADGTVVPLPDPQTLTWDIYDLDGESTGRDQTGELFRDRQAVKRKINCTWGPLCASWMSYLLYAVEDEFFELQYPDAKEGQNQTITAYVGDRSAPAYTLHEGRWLWSGLEMNFIER